MPGYPLRGETCGVDFRLLHKLSRRGGLLGVGSLGVPGRRRGREEGSQMKRARLGLAAVAALAALALPTLAPAHEATKLNEIAPNTALAPPPIAASPPAPGAC